jgi:hypothetical protein
MDLDYVVIPICRGKAQARGEPHEPAPVHFPPPPPHQTTPSSNGGNVTGIITTVHFPFGTRRKSRYRIKTKKIEKDEPAAQRTGILGYTRTHLVYYRYEEEVGRKRGRTNVKLDLGTLSISHSFPFLRSYLHLGEHTHFRTGLMNLPTHSHSTKCLYSLVVTPLT